MLVVGLSLAAIVSALALLRGLPPGGGWILVAMLVLISGGCAMFLKLEPYHVTYVLKSPAWASSIAMLLTWLWTRCGLAANHQRYQ